MTTTNTRFVAKNGLDVNGNSILNLGAVGASLALAGASALVITLTGATSVTFPTSGTLATLASTVANATTANALATPRTINGVSFDGSANITIVPAATANATVLGTTNAAVSLVGFAGANAPMTIAAGAPGAGTAGNSLTIAAGAANGASGNGGGLTLRSGDSGGVGSGVAGPVLIHADNTAGGTAGGTITIRGGNTATNGASATGGNVTISGGNSTNGSTSGVGGNVTLAGGTSATTTAGSLFFTTAATERMRISNTGALMFAGVAGTVGQVLTSDANGIASWQPAASGAAAANALTGTTLASNVVTSSLTSVGALLNVNTGTAITSQTLQAYTAGSYAAVYSNSVTPSATNFSLAHNGAQTYLNGTTSSALSVNNVPVATATSTGLALAGNLTFASGKFLALVNGSGTVATRTLFTSSSATDTYSSVGVANSSATQLVSDFSSVVGNTGTTASVNATLTTNTSYTSIQTDMQSANVGGIGSKIIAGSVGTGAALPIILLSSPSAGAAVVERLRITPTGALAVAGAANYGTAGQVLTSNGNAAPSWAASTFAGGTVAGATTFTSAAPQITLNNATSNYIQYAANGVGAPAFTTRSAGTKLVLYPNITASAVDFAIGIEAANLWFSVADSGQAYKWYAGQTAIMQLLGTGALTFGGGAAATASGYGTAGQVLTSNGSASPTWQTAALSALANASTLGTVANTAQTFTGLTSTTATANIAPMTVQAGSTAAAAAGNNLVLQGGSNTNGGGWKGGGVIINGGTGDSGSHSGTTITLTAGASTVANDAGTGFISITGGAASGTTSTGGAVNLSGGTGTSAGGALVFSTAPTTTLTERFRILATGDWSVGTNGTSVGTAGQVLTSNGSGAAPTWAAPTPSSLTNATVLGTTGAAVSLVGFASATPGTMTIQGSNATAGSSATGGNLTVKAGSGATTNGGGGSINIQPGDGSGTGAQGSITIGATNSSGTANTGAILIQSGANTSGSTGGSGNVSMGTGNVTQTGTTAASGNVSIKTGDSSGTATTANSGTVLLSSGATNGATSGVVTVTTGAGANTGALNLSTGNTSAASGVAGAVNITAGNATGTTATGGSVNISAGTGTTVGGAIVFKTAATTTAAEAMHILPTGEVGVGVAGTATAGTQLAVSSTVGTVALFDSSFSTGGYLTFSQSKTAFGYIGNAGSLTAGGTLNDMGIRSAGAISFSGPAGAERMRILSTGEVGIGDRVAVAGTKLSVGSISDTINTVNVNTGGAGKSQLILNVSGTSALGLMINNSGTTDSIYGIPTGTVGLGSYSNSNFPIVFAVGNAERMRVDGGGNVMVGMTSYQTAPLQGFSVSGNSSTSTFTGHASGTPTGATYSGYVYNGTTIGSITQNGTTGVIYGSASDRRLKKDIVDAGSAIDLLNALQVRAFNWKNADEPVLHGFIAQELAEVIPDAVKQGDTDPDTVTDAWAVDTSRLVPILVKSLQEALARITALEQQVAAKPAA